MSKNSRVVLEIDTNTMEDLERMKKELNVRTTTELLRRCLGLMSWYLRRRNEGYTIMTKKGNEVSEVEILN